MRKITPAIRSISNHPRHPFVNSPEGLADTLRPIIEGKIVCDVGCRDGVFLIELAEYAKRVIGIEKREEDAEKAKIKGFHIIHGNAATIKLPKADVYYIWVEENALVPISENIKDGIKIFGSYLGTENEGIKKHLKDGIKIHLNHFKTESGHDKLFELTIIDQRKNI